ncbi:MAG: glycosyltransferase family 4 protein [Thermoanaerobaculia bacterium]
MTVSIDVPAGAAAPRLCIAGSLMGRTPGKITTQGEILGDTLLEAGWHVIFTSSVESRALRLLDVVRTLVLERRAYDVLLVQTYSGRSFVLADVASALGGWLGKGVILHLHGGALPEFLDRHPWWGRRVLSRGTLLVTPSEFLARAARRFGFEPRVIPNVVDVAAYGFRRRDAVQPVLFWMRSFHDLYDPEMAVRVLARVRRVYGNATLVMAGPDKGREVYVRKLAAELGLSGAVRFAGFLDLAGKRRESSEADIFLNTNRVDNQPVSVLEACAMGLPVVATAVGGIPDLLVHEETGLLVPAGDDEAMAEAVLRLVAEPGLAGRLSSNGRRLAEQSAPVEILRRWRDVLGGPAPFASRGEAT